MGLIPAAYGETSVPIDDQKVAPPVAKAAPYTSTVLNILSALTLDEKLSLSYGATDPDQTIGNVGYLPGVPRLGVPVRRDADAFGVQVAHDATAGPLRMGLGATFDRQAVLAWGKVAGSEARALKVDLLYGPQVDLTRQPNWGRNNATFGEDPFLSGQLGIQEIDGIQSEGTLACLKHFAFYHGQSGSGFGGANAPSLPSLIDDQTAHELYLKTYEYAVTTAKPAMVMASYQAFQVTPLQQVAAWASDNPLTETTILRGQWDFRGIVLSDYGATHSVHAILSGQDQDFPGTRVGTGGAIPGFYAPDLKPLVDPTSPTYNSAYVYALDQACARVLYGYERFGLLDGSVGQRPDIAALKAPHQAVAQALSEEAAVLMKNTNNLLPLGRSGGKVAIIGPTARQTMVDGNTQERSRGFADRDAISPLQQLVALAPSGVNFTYAPGIDWIGSVVPASALPGGLTRTANNSRVSRVDTTLDYESSNANGSTPNDLKPGVTYTWTGMFNAATADTYYLWLQQSWLENNGSAVTVTIDGTNRSFFTPTLPAYTYPNGVVPPHGTNRGVVVPLTAGNHSLVIKAIIPLATKWNINQNTPIAFDGPLTFRFTYSQLGQTLNDAAAAARAADVAVVFVDDNGTTSSGGGVVSLTAPNEDTLVQAVVAANPNTVVVLNTGDPVLMPWNDSVSSILEMWYPGQEGGTSTARVLLGLANPSGKMPITWPASIAQTPFGNNPERLKGNGSNVPFSEALGMGYRWYDQQNLTPLYVFGHGLSYTTFNYSNLQVTPNKGGATVAFDLKNTGAVAGAEVPQVYVNPSPNLPPGVASVPRKLVGFDRVQLAAGETKHVTIDVSKLELSYWSTADQDWNFAKGKRTIYVGASSRDIRLQAQVNPQGTAGSGRDEVAAQ